MTSLQWSAVYGMPSVWYLGLVYFFYGFSYIIYMTFFAAYLVKEMGFTQAYAGGLWALVGRSQHLLRDHLGTYFRSSRPEPRCCTGLSRPGIVLHCLCAHQNGIRVLSFCRDVRPHGLEHPDDHGRCCGRFCRAAAWRLPASASSRSSLESDRLWGLPSEDTWRTSAAPLPFLFSWPEGSHSQGWWLPLLEKPSLRRTKRPKC